MRDTVSVLDFGALGDGLTDDTTACDEAIATGKAVLWPEGHTFITQGHDLASANQRMVICGTIKLKNATNKAVFRVKAHHVQICFEGGEIHGNKANQST